MSLFEDIMKGHWDAVVEKYRGEARKHKISVTRDTTMHLAARFDKKNRITEMLGRIGEDEAFEILRIKNDRGNTALHIAEELGDPVVCHRIATKDVRLLSLRNHDGATPLYVSVANGHRNAFFALDLLVQNIRRESGNAVEYSMYKINSGYTILHTAVSREFLGFALNIANTYPELVNLADESGWTPLHILARKREAFLSTSQIGRLNSIILNWINVDQLVTKEQEIPVICNIAETENSGSNPTSSYGTNSQNTRTQKCSNEGVGNIASYIFSTLFSIIALGLAVLNYIHFFPAKLAFAMVGLEFPDIDHSIQCATQRIKNVREAKLRWRMACILLHKLVDEYSLYRNDHNLVSRGLSSSLELLEDDGKKRLDTPFLIAARNGVIEVVKEIQQKFPIAAFDVDSELKNAAMLAAERKQVRLFEFLLENHPEETNRMLLQLDKQGNNVLHHCATFQDQMVLTNTPSPALLLGVHYSWFQFMKTKVPPEFSHLHNSSGLTADEVFMKTHKELIKSGSEWLVKTSESCSVVAALITTVAFATSAVGPPSESNEQKFIGVPLFDLYLIFALIGLCFSISSLLHFLSIRTSRFQVKDFAAILRMKLYRGLLFLLSSMVFILTSFCFRHYSNFSNLNGEMRTILIVTYIFSIVGLASLSAYLLPFHGTAFEFQFHVKEYKLETFSQL